MHTDRHTVAHIHRHTHRERKRRGRGQKRGRRREERGRKKELFLGRGEPSTGWAGVSLPKGCMQKSCPSRVVRAKGQAVSQHHGVRLAVAGAVEPLPVAERIGGMWAIGKGQRTQDGCVGRQRKEQL